MDENQHEPQYVATPQATPPGLIPWSVYLGSAVVAVVVVVLAAPFFNLLGEILMLLFGDEPD